MRRALALCLLAAACSPSGPATTAPAASVSPWRSLAPLRVARQEVAATVLDGKVWVIGGLVESGATPTTEVYNPSTGAWTEGPDVPVPLHHAAAVTYRGEVVVIGGFLAGSGDLFARPSDRVFGLRGGRWQDLPRLGRARGSAGAAVIDDLILVAGGADGARLIAESEVFDGTSWHDVAPIPTPRDHLAVASDGHHAYAVGGRALSISANSSAVEVYHPEADKWLPAPSMEASRGGLGAALVDGRLCAVGGESLAGNNAETECLWHGRWERLAAMRTPRHGIGVVAIDSVLYAVAGGLRPGLAPSTVAEAIDIA